VRALLNYLSSMQVMVYQPDTHAYALTTTATTFLVRANKCYAGDWVLANTDPVLWDKMLETIRSGKSAGYTMPWEQDAWLESYSPSRIAYSLELWGTVDVEIDQHQPFHIIDLACGCGIKTLGFAQAHHSVKVTCLDSPAVLEVAQDLAKRLDVESQIILRPGNLLSDDFGINQFDAALLGLITYILTPKQNADVFRRAFRALRPGGRLVIDAIMSTDQPAEWASRATLLMNTWNGGAAYSFTSYETWLKQAGFTKVIQKNEQLLFAIK
jgi:ubiquinone/menaquinone biosynthesis C-methylase UbiE